MKTTACILSALVASAAAFAPSGTSSTRGTTSALNAADFKGQVGAQMPLGFWDPMNMVGSGDQGRFDRLREVEIKHGRIA